MFLIEPAGKMVLAVSGWAWMLVWSSMLLLAAAFAGLECGDGYSREIFRFLLDLVALRALALVAPCFCGYRGQRRKCISRLAHCQ